MDNSTDPLSTDEFLLIAACAPWHSEVRRRTSTPYDVDVLMIDADQVVRKMWLPRMVVLLEWETRPVVVAQLCHQAGGPPVDAVVADSSLIGWVMIDAMIWPVFHTLLAEMNSKSPARQAQRNQGREL